MPWKRSYSSLRVFETPQQSHLEYRPQKKLASLDIVAQPLLLLRELDCVLGIPPLFHRRLGENFEGGSNDRPPRSELSSTFASLLLKTTVVKGQEVVVDLPKEVEVMLGLKLT